MYKKVEVMVLGLCDVFSLGGTVITLCDVEFGIFLFFVW